MPFFLVIALAVETVLIIAAVVKGAESEGGDGDGGAS